jgi:hypothetical protein
MPRPRPLLESLEGRFAPAAAPDLPAAEPPARLGEPDAPAPADLLNVAFSLLLPDAPPGGAAGAEPEPARALFIPPALPGSAPVARPGEPPFRFPASGGGGDDPRPFDHLAEAGPFAPAEEETGGETPAEPEGDIAPAADPEPEASAPVEPGVA